MERFIFSFFCFLLLWAPIPIGSNRHWSVALLGALVAINFCLWLVFGQNKPPRAFHNNKLIVYLFFLAPLWLVIQLIPLPAAVVYSISPNVAQYDPSQAWQTISLNHQATIYSLQSSLTYALFFVMALLLLDTPQRLETTFQVIIISGVLQACYGVLAATGGPVFDFLHIHDIINNHAHSATGTYINRNHFAGYLEMCLAIGIGLLVSQIMGNRNRYAGWRAFVRELLVSLFSGKARLRIFLALMVVGLVLSHSRMGNSAFFASLGVCGVIGLWLYRKHSNAKSLVILFSSLIVVDIFILGAWFGLDRLAKRLEETSVENENRTFAFERTLSAVQDFWLTGSGGGSYYSTFTSYRNNQIYRIYEEAHNDFLQFLVEFGVIGSALFAIIVIFCFVRAIQAQIYRNTAILKGAGFAAMMGIMSIMLHSTTDFNLQIPANAALFSVLCGFACIAYSMDYQEHSPRKMKSRS